MESIGSLMRAEEVTTDEKIKWLCAAPAPSIAQWQPSPHTVGCAARHHRPISQLTLAQCQPTAPWLLNAG